MREAFGCNCIGPQNGEPLCPCMMEKERPTAPPTATAGTTPAKTETAT